MNNGQPKGYYYIIIYVGRQERLFITIENRHRKYTIKDKDVREYYSPNWHWK